MSLERIYVVRHGFRMAWTVDNEGNYRSSFPTPTGIPADPVLTSHGLDQAEQLATHLATLNPPVDIVYSSPYYRCLQTINPYVKAQAAALEAGTLPDAQRDTARIRGEHGVCEWFGAAPFAHPQPADQATLKGLFPLYDDEFLSPVKPRVKGETYVQMVGRVRDAMRALIKRCDDEGRKAVVICSHAAVIIALGRVLTGQYPEEMETDDFKAFTCGLSVYARSEGRGIDGKDDNVGNWTCEKNSDCSFLVGGEERGWKFAGDESFPGTGSMAQDDNGAVEPKL